MIKKPSICGRLSLLALVILPAVNGEARAGQTFFVDCSFHGAGAGTSSDDPLGSLAEVNRRTFGPGDRILFRRGTLCQGQLWPKGSGRPSEPIVLAAYGAGRMPVIDGGEHFAAVHLFNQQYWDIGQLEVRGGTPHGVLVTGDEGVLRHIRLSNLTVHGGTGSAANKRTGLVAVIAGDPDQSFEEVRLEGITAYNTTQWAGIVVDGGAPGLPRGAEGRNPETRRARNVTVRNCLVHDVGGDGIILFRVENGLIEKSVAWNTGMMHLYTDEGPKNPNAIWTWNCHRCTVQFNEGFLADTAGVDGGVYDIDWGSSESVIQYNFGHDSQGYCLSVFGAGGTATADSTVRYNLCVNNGRSPRLAKRQGDIYLSTWGGGSLDGVRIHNNTVFWNPPTEAPAVRNEAGFVGSRENVFAGNVILSTVPTMVDSVGNGLDFDHNFYWYTGPGSPSWKFGDQTFHSLQAMKERESNGLYADPELRGSREEHAPALLLAPTPGSAVVRAVGEGDRQARYDVLGRPLPRTGRAAGAIEAWPEGNPTEIVAMEGLSFGTLSGGRQELIPGEWVLMTFLRLEDDSETLLDEQSQTVFLRSLQQQFGRSGLRIYLVIPKSTEALKNRSYDWNLQDLTILIDEGNRLGGLLPVRKVPSTILFSPDLRGIRAWDRLVYPAELGLVLRSVLGPPAGFAEIEVNGFSSGSCRMSRLTSRTRE